MKRWKLDIVEPFLGRELRGLEALVTLLKTVLVRHSKDDLKLHEPLRSRMDLDPLYEALEVNGNWMDYLKRAPSLYDQMTIDIQQNKW